MLLNLKTLGIFLFAWWLVVWTCEGVVNILSTLQRRDPERSRSRSPSPQSWPAGSSSTLKTSRSGRRTAAGLQRWSTISEITC